MWGRKNAIDLTGRRFGRLVCVERAPNSSCGATMWICTCDCGNTVTVQYANLTRGATMSCGCLNREKRAERNYKHGGDVRGKQERLYRVWHGMWERCTKEHHISYQYYGANGVTVCDEWKEYQSFREWAMSNGYDPNAERGKCTLDRIDPTGNYEPANCRWTSMAEQNHNRRADHVRSA